MRFFTLIIPIFVLANKKTSNLIYHFNSKLARPFFLLSILIFCVSQLSFATKIVGKVVDLGSKKALTSVSVFNIYTGEEFITLGNGLFEMEVKKGDLVEFRVPGYEIGRVRLKSDSVANYYLIQLIPTSTKIENQLYQDYFTGAKIDSIKRSELYSQALNHYTLTGLDIIQHPFDAMSKQNQKIWAFQKNYQFWEKEKFVDYVFNDRLIVQLTGLKGDDLDEYKKQYRPQYEQIRSMNEYQYYTFVKKSVEEYLKRKEDKTKPRENYNYDR